MTDPSYLEVPPAYRGLHDPIQLPFHPRELRGLSEELLLSHHQHYASDVRALNAVEVELRAVTKETLPLAVLGLKERQLGLANSLTLHELYFASLGGDGLPSGSVANAIAQTYGSFARWDEEFRATALSLAGGRGWVTLDFELLTRSLRIHGSRRNTQAKAGWLPVLVLDMHEHAYRPGFGTGVARYVDVFFENVRWEEVERRYGGAMRAAAELSVGGP